MMKYLASACVVFVLLAISLAQNGKPAASLPAHGELTSPTAVYEYGYAPSAGTASLSGSLNFGVRHQENGPTFKTATLTNTGSANITITSIKLQSVEGPFSISSTTCGTTLNVGTNCTITIELFPADGGIGVNTDTLIVTDSATNSPQKASMTATICEPSGC